MDDKRIATCRRADVVARVVDKLKSMAIPIFTSGLPINVHAVRNLKRHGPLQPRPQSVAGTPNVEVNATKRRQSADLDICDTSPIDC